MKEGETKQEKMKLKKERKRKRKKERYRERGVLRERMAYATEREKRQKGGKCIR